VSQLQSVGLRFRLSCWVVNGLIEASWPISDIPLRWRPKCWPQGQSGLESLTSVIIGLITYPYSATVLATHFKLETNAADNFLRPLGIDTLMWLENGISYMQLLLFCCNFVELVE